MGRLLALVVLAAACGYPPPSLQPHPDATPGATDAADAAADADKFRDAPATTTVQLTVSGTANASMPLSGVTVSAYRNSDETTAVATTTTDGSGNYTLSFQTNGESFDGFVEATRQGYLDTYFYPPYALTMNYHAPLALMTQAALNTLYTLGAASQQAGTGAILLAVQNGGTPVGGAVVTSNPSSPVRYNDSNGNPSPTQTVTYTDGVAYVFNAPPGQITVRPRSGPRMAKSTSRDFFRGLIA